MFKIRDTVECTYGLRWNKLQDFGCAANSVTLSNVRGMIYETLVTSVHNP